MSVYILCLSERYSLVNVCQHNCLFLNFHSFCYLYVYRIAALNQKGFDNTNVFTRDLFYYYYITI